mmetsp:Transcript_46995/g.86136  ORF Transcript_46995/g.86136 Transcript_46995/m.86136 type:complete len:88 (+) Transcript_46995:343-606(+)
METIEGGSIGVWKAWAFLGKGINIKWKKGPMPSAIVLCEGMRKGQGALQAPMIITERCGLLEYLQCACLAVQGGMQEPNPRADTSVL